jgi:hypothetical protein
MDRQEEMLALPTFLYETAAFDACVEAAFIGREREVRSFLIFKIGKSCLLQNHKFYLPTMMAFFHPGFGRRQPPFRSWDM